MRAVLGVRWVVSTTAGFEAGDQIVQCTPREGGGKQVRVKRGPDRFLMLHTCDAALSTALGCTRLDESFQPAPLQTPAAQACTVVYVVAPGSLAAHAGLEVGDTVLGCQPRKGRHKALLALRRSSHI